MTSPRAANLSIVLAAAGALAGAALAETGPAVAAETNIDEKPQTFKGLFSHDKDQDLFTLNGVITGDDTEYESNFTFSSAGLNTLVVQEFQGSYTISDADGPVIDVVVEPALLEGVERATAYDAEGKQLAQVTLSGVEGSLFDANVADVVLLAYLYATVMEAITEGCDPTFAECHEQAALACKDHGIKKVDYQCTPVAGGHSTTCNIECNSPPPPPPPAGE